MILNSICVRVYYSEESRSSHRAHFVQESGQGAQKEGGEPIHLIPPL